MDPTPCPPLMQPELFERRIQYKPPGPLHQSSMQGHVLCDERQRREVQEYSSPPWNGQTLFENQDENVEYGSDRYSHSDRADMTSYPGVESHSYGGARAETCVPYPGDNVRYENHFPVERGPEKQFGHTEDAAGGNVCRQHPHIRGVGELSHPPLQRGRGYLEHGGPDMRVAVPQFPDDHHRYSPDPQPVSVSVPSRHPLQHSAGVHDRNWRGHRPDVRFNGDEVVTKECHVKAPRAKSQKARVNRVPSQAVLSLMNHDANTQFKPPFKKVRALLFARDRIILSIYILLAYCQL